MLCSKCLIPSSSPWTRLQQSCEVKIINSLFGRWGTEAYGGWVACFTFTWASKWWSSDLNLNSWGELDPKAWALTGYTGINAASEVSLVVFLSRYLRQLQTWWPTVKLMPRKTPSWLLFLPQRTHSGRRSFSVPFFKSPWGSRRALGLLGHWCRVFSKVGTFPVHSI